MPGSLERSSSFCISNSVSPLVSNDESIKVFVRVRPPDPNLDSDLQRGVCLDVTSDKTLTVYSKPDPKTFTFDHVAGKNTTQVTKINSSNLVQPLK